MEIPQAIDTSGWSHLPPVPHSTRHRSRPGGTRIPGIIATSPDPAPDARRRSVLTPREPHEPRVSRAGTDGPRLPAGER